VKSNYLQLGARKEAIQKQLSNIDKI